MPDISGTDVEKQLGILVLSCNTFGHGVVNRLVESHGKQITGLHIVFGINNGIAKREMKIPERSERKHIGSNKLIVIAVPFFYTVFEVVTAAVRYIGDEPTVDIVHFKPLSRFET